MNQKNKNYAHSPSNTKQIDYFDDSQQFTKDFQKLLCDSQANNQRWSQPMTIPNPRKIPTYSETPIINEQNVIVIKSDHRQSVEDMIDSQNIHKLRQKARQLSRTNQKLKQQNLQLRLQKMKLASNSETIRLLELKLQIQQLGKSIAELQKQKQGVLKAKETQQQFRLTN